MCEALVDDQCTGISIVWSALCGYCWMVYYENKNKSNEYDAHYRVLWALSVTTVYCSILWVYYLIVEALITTIAHVCAVLLGLVIGFTFNRLSQLNTNYHRIPINEVCE